MTPGEHRHLRPEPDPDVVRLRTARSLDWAVFLLVGAIGTVVALWLRPLAAILPGAIALVGGWMLLQRTTIDRRRRVFGVHAPWRRGASAATRPLGPLSVRKHVKVSKGTTTVTYEVLAGDEALALGLPYVTAEELSSELADWLGEPRPPMPP